MSASGKCTTVGPHYMMKEMKGVAEKEKLMHFCISPCIPILMEICLK
jgi:hypothetical protein